MCWTWSSFVVTEARDIDMLGYCRSQTGRHLMLVVRSPSEVINPLLFFLLVIILFPLGLGPDPQQLSVLAPGILWVVALLANLMICMRLFVDDFEDGSLEQLAMARIPLAVAVLPQLVASWLASGLLLSLISPLFGLMLGLPLSVAPVLVASLLMGTAIMLLLGAVGASLTVGVQRGGILLALLILPLYVPVLIAGTRALNEAVQGGDPTIALALLGAGVTSGLMLAPLAIAAGVRVSLEL
ncbi:MAG: heme exporter protein CcmB [Gammaproteobacteria bacterium]|nr:heme exporter protein CcmB [Gammaproteobacteria bacterium]